MFGFSLAEQERLLHVYRQSKVILVPAVVLGIIVIVLPWYFLASRDIAGYGPYLGGWSLFVILVTLRKYILWRVNKYVITSDRLISVSHEEMFRKVVIETPLDRILNISFRTTGLASVVFGYGNVEVQVVGLMEPIVLKNIQKPAFMKDYLWQAHLNFMKHTKSEVDIPHLQEKNGYTKRGQKVV